MSSFFLFMIFFLFPAALTSAIDVRQMSIDEYINFVNPPAVHKYKDKFGDSMLCINFSDHISVKYAHDNITRGLKKIPKLKPWTRNISGFDSGGANISKLGIKAECPEGTVVVREIKREDVERAGSVARFLDRGRGNHLVIPHSDPQDSNDDDDDDGPVSRLHAVIVYDSYSGAIAGASAQLNVWRPEIPSDGIFSLSQIWLVAPNGGIAETIEAGWTVYPGNYGDDEPRFFVYWTSKNYENGCYDNECPGFVQIHGATSAGSRLSPVSAYGGNQYTWKIAVKQQEIGGETVWALHLDDEAIGYWPASMFVSLADGANQFHAGGEIVTRFKKPGSRFSSTPMGSGHFPNAGYRHAAYTRSIQIFGSDGHEMHLPLRLLPTNPACYNIDYFPDDDSSWGKHIFFGGPGGSNNPNCVVGY